MGEHKLNPHGQPLWISHGQAQSVPNRLITWAQVRTRIGDVYVGSDWENTIRPYGQPIWTANEQTQAVPYRLPTWAQGKTHIGGL